MILTATPTCRSDFVRVGELQSPTLGPSRRRSSPRRERRPVAPRGRTPSVHAARSRPRSSRDDERRREFVVQKSEKVEWRRLERNERRSCVRDRRRRGRGRVDWHGTRGGDGRRVRERASGAGGDARSSDAAQRTRTGEENAQRLDRRRDAHCG